MKQAIFLLAIVVSTLTSCGSGNSQTKDNTAGDKIPEKESVPLMAGLENQQKTAEGGAILLTREMFLENVWDYTQSPQEWKYTGDKPAIIDFYADWCGPCKIASPILEEISTEYAGTLYVYKIDTEKERELASVFGIRSIPSFLYIPVNGKPVMMAGIGRSKEETKNMFVENINKYLLQNNP
jgi:thioredoxin 1